jgi:hypothetical protein
MGTGGASKYGTHPSSVFKKAFRFEFGSAVVPDSIPKSASEILTRLSLSSKFIAASRK